MWINANNLWDSDDSDREQSYRGYRPSKDFDSYTYELYLKFAEPEELEFDVVKYKTMYKMWKYVDQIC
jgi:hypothetical protein